MCRSFLRALLMATIFVVLSAPLFAQQTGSVIGTVADKTGAVVAHAKVTLINTATKDIRTTTTNSEGFFAFNGAVAGDYSVKVELKGFRTAEEAGIHLSPGDRRNLDVSLEVGVANEQIVVTAATSGIEVVDSGDLSSTLNTKDINNLSLQGRDVTELLKTMPGFSNNTGFNGLQNKNGYDTTITSIASGVGNALTAPGVSNRAGGADLVADGAHILDPGCACNANQTVNPDMVAEVKVSTSAYSADSTTGPVVVSAVGKSGSSEYHGSAYFHFRDHAMNSNDWYSNHLGVARPSDRYLYPGGQASGPVPLTHKKLFFFTAYEYYNQSFPESMTNGVVKANVPTLSERAGHFDPTLADNAAECGAIASWISGQYRCQPITSITTLNGNVANIVNNDVSAYIAPTSAVWLKLIPSPNHTPSSSQDFNYVKSLLNTNNGYMYHAKVDYNLNDSTKLYVSYNQQHELYGSPMMRWWLAGGSIDSPGSPSSSDLSRTISGSLVKVFNSTTTNEFLAGLSYMDAPITLGNEKALDKTALGYQWKYPGLTTMMPSLSSAWTNGDFGIPAMMDLDRVSYFTRKMQPSISDNFTKVFGTHAVKVGASWLRSGNRQANVDQGTGKNGTIAYQPIWDSNTSSWNPVLDLLLDRPGSFSYMPDTIADMANNSFGFYGEDEWKVNKRLTLNYGLRFSHETPWADATGKFGAATFSKAWYNADLANNVTNLPGVRWHAKDNAVSLAGHSLDSMFYGPRFGVAYDPFGKGKTFFRGGFGSYYYHDGLAGYDSAVGVAMGGTSCNITTATFLSQIDTGTNVSCANTGTGVTDLSEAVDPTDHTEPRTLTYNFTVSQQVIGKSLLEVSYSGSQSANLINPLGNQNITPLGAYMQADPNPASSNYGKVLPISTINSNNNSEQQDYKPFTHYKKVNLISHGAWANYNALQVSWSKHQGPLNYNLNYTWSKTLGIGATPDPVDINNDYGIVGQDRTHVFNTSYSYEVGNRFKNNKLEGAILNGWMISGITILQSGAPLQQSSSANFNLGGTNAVPDITLPGGSSATKFNSVSSTYYLGEAGDTAYSLMPKLTCNPASGRTGGQYINPSCFSLPTAPSFDANGHLIAMGGQGQYQWPYLRGPAYFSSDLSLSRTIRVTEHQNAQIKFTGMNFLNHALNSFDQNNANNINLNYTTGVLATSDKGWQYGVPNERFGRRVLELTVKYNF